MDEEEFMYYWSKNNDMDKEIFEHVLELNIDASEEYHLYHTYNNEAS